MDTAHVPSVFDVAAILITLTATLSWLNHKFLRLPSTVGLALMGVMASLLVLAIDFLTPRFHIGESVRAFIATVDFEATLMQGMLSFLLFAGALHVDLSDLRRHRWQVGVLSTLGVLVSTAIVGFGLMWLTQLAGIELPLIWCLLFGALISPTDPVAVMGAMKHAETPPGLQATVSGESLFNDGVGVVVFSIILAAAAGDGFSASHAASMFFIEAVGGAALGLAVGWIGFFAMRAIDDYPVELLVTLAMVMGGYALAQNLHISGPVAMAVAGLLIGNRGVALAMSDTTRDYVIKFWGLVDEILNAVLFLLIGLEGIALVGNTQFLLIGLASIPMVLVARAASTGAPLLLWRKSLPFQSTFPVLVWGGLRGGISIALALSLPSGPPKDLILTATYVVVLFSVLIQGSSINRVLPRVGGTSTT
ncbi:MAG TPA: sodium:proton antiporter [Hyphomonadaceae bacterium]|nr:sodium:proton antiporter [Hyphomonadaceae bacterium]HPI47788.1 sodium:proton antiporter [Hyphomonadaceae bacterium]